MRKITVNNEVWEWFCGRSFVKLKSPMGKQYVIPCHVISGVDAYTFECGQHKRTYDGMILPSHVRHTILTLGKS